MSHKEEIIKAFKQGKEVSTRACEDGSIIMANYPDEPRRQAIKHLRSKGYKIDKFPRINPNTQKDYWIWKIVEIAP
jgi:hypothetical protein